MTYKVIYLKLWLNRYVADRRFETKEEAEKYVNRMKKMFPSLEERGMFLIVEDPERRII